MYTYIIFLSFLALQKENKKAQYAATALQITPWKWLCVQSVRQFMVTQIKQYTCSFYVRNLGSYRTTDINSPLRIASDIIKK